MLQYTDMEPTVAKEIMDICTNACEKYSANNQQASRDCHGREGWRGGVQTSDVPGREMLGRLGDSYFSS